MGSLAAQYCEQINNHFKVFYATFPPNQPYQLGDFGILNDDVFVRIGNVTQRFDLNFGVRAGEAKSPAIDFTSKGSVTVEFRSKAEAGIGTVPVKAGLDITFARENSVFFNAAECTLDSVEDQVKLGEQIIGLYNQRKWEKKYAVVTGVLRAKSTTAIVSSSANSSISLDAATPDVAAINLADASLKLTVKSVRDVALKIVTEGELVPLINLSKIQGGFLSRGDFGPLEGAFSLEGEAADPAENKALTFGRI